MQFRKLYQCQLHLLSLEVYIEILEYSEAFVKSVVFSIGLILFAALFSQAATRRQLTVCTKILSYFVHFRFGRYKYAGGKRLPTLLKI